MNKKAPFYIVLIFLPILLIIGFYLRPKAFVEINPDLLPSPSADGEFTVLSANVGNSNLYCRPYLWKLCLQDVEEQIATNLKILEPDIAVLQEVLAPWQCKGSVEDNQRLVCNQPQTVHQARRLLGEGYTIICDSHWSLQCIGVKTTLGEIDGCPMGKLCLNGRTLPVIEGCDPGFNVTAATVVIQKEITFDVVNIHLTARNAACRQKMLAATFLGSETSPGLVVDDEVLVLGDFNMDVWRDDDVSVRAWQEIFESGWNARPFRYHSGIAESLDPYYTFNLDLIFLRKTLDLVASNFLEGNSVVLGQSPGTTRLDGGTNMDHSALFGVFREAP